MSTPRRTAQAGPWLSLVTSLCLCWYCIMPYNFIPYPTVTHNTPNHTIPRYTLLAIPYHTVPCHTAYHAMPNHSRPDQASPLFIWSHSIYHIYHTLACSLSTLPYQTSSQGVYHAMPCHAMPDAMPCHEVHNTICSTTIPFIHTMLCYQCIE